MTILLSSDFLRRAALDKFEYPILILLATLGMLLLISADNLIALYLGLELMSLALYVVAAFARDDGRASEAGLKYFVLGALSSGMMLYGSSLLYGFSGTVSFDGHRGGRLPLGADRRDLRSRFRSGGSRLQNVGGALPYVDARRLRGRADAGDGLLRFCRESGGGRDHGAHRH